MHWSHWTGKRGCIDFDLNWATFMVNFTWAVSSAHHFTPSLLAERKLHSFFTWGSTAVWRTDTRALTRTQHDVLSSRHSTHTCTIYSWPCILILLRTFIWNAGIHSLLPRNPIYFPTVIVTVILWEGHGLWKLTEDSIYSPDKEVVGRVKRYEIFTLW